MTLVEIRSYRRVFDLERRIYRVDRVRLNPGGIPIRGVLYGIVSLACMLLLRGIPLLGALVGIAPWYLTDLALPILVAALLSAIRIEGRPFHLAALALVRHASAPRLYASTPMCSMPGRRWHPEDLLFLVDGSDARLRGLRYTGPGAALIVPAHERIHLPRGPLARWAGRPELSVSELMQARPPDRATVIELAPGVRLTVR